jgi:acetyl-CoA carboxylase carboxyl transferase subunit alpha
VDDIVREPTGGSHQDPVEASRGLAASIRRHLAEIMQIPAQSLLDRRYEKFRAMGKFSEGAGRVPESSP